MGTELTGLQKAAVLLMSLEEDHAATLLNHVSESALVSLRKAADTIDVSQIGEEQKRLVLQGFFARQQSGAVTLGDADWRFRRALVKAKGEEQASRIWDSADQDEEMVAAGLDSPVLRIERAADESVAHLAGTESPRCVAAMLSRLTSEKAGRVLSLLPDELKEAVVGRLVASEGAPPGVVEEIVQCFAQKLEDLESEGNMQTEQERYEQLAGMIGKLDPESQQRVIERVGREDQEMAEKLEQLMFQFEDLEKVSSKSMQELLRRVEVPSLALALKGAAQGVVDHFQQNLSSRARERVEEEREIAGRVPMSEAVAAREEIMKVARKMLKDGEITVEMGGEEYVE